MKKLKRVSFKKGREHKPRLSKPYVPGRHSKTYWSEAEKETVRKYYPNGGVAACLVHLPERTPQGVYQIAKKLGLSAKQGGAWKTKAVNGMYDRPGIDDEIRHEYPLLERKKALKATQVLADKLKVPRWWLIGRATKLGLTNQQRKEPDWTAAEVELLKKVPLHDPDKCSQIFREHGFQRSANGIMVKSKRLNLSRRYRETLSATQCAKILGVDGKTFSVWCALGEVKAHKRTDTKRLPQQGGAPWSVKPADLRQFILDNIGRIDIRRVDKIEFVFVVAGEAPKEAKQPETERRVA
jgi:hypothetical protein